MDFIIISIMTSPTILYIISILDIIILLLQSNIMNLFYQGIAVFFFIKGFFIGIVEEYPGTCRIHMILMIFSAIYIINLGVKGALYLSLIFIFLILRTIIINKTKK
jgi:hypothetical protein